MPRSVIDIIHPMQHTSLLKRIKHFVNTPRGAGISMWVAYFIFWGGGAAVLPYISVYYDSIALRGSQIGTLNSIPYFISLISSITFAFLSDVSRRNKLVLGICIAGLIATLLLFPTAGSFATLVPIVLMWSIFHAPTGPIMDQTTLVSLSDPNDYGRIRVGGSIGWAIMVSVTGYLIDNLGFGLPIIFYINAAFLACFFLFIYLIPSQHRVEATSGSRASLKAIRDLLRQPGFLIFLVLLVIWGIGEAAIGNFLFLHIKYLGGSSTLMGTALSASLIGEIVAFSLANRIQRRLGAMRMVLASFLVLFTWLMGISLIRNPYVIPFFQVFGGAGFALIQSGSVGFVDTHAPKSIGTTAQAIRSGILAGLGVGTGSLLSGMIYEAAGSVFLFRIMAIFILVGFFVALLFYLRDRRRNGAAGITSSS
jgi:PPP family 3-phenylpropionic acid transporter